MGRALDGVASAALSLGGDIRAVARADGGLRQVWAGRLMAGNGYIPLTHLRAHKFECPDYAPGWSLVAVDDDAFYDLPDGGSGRACPTCRMLASLEPQPAVIVDIRTGRAVWPARR